MTFISFKIEFFLQQTTYALRRAIFVLDFFTFLIDLKKIRR